MNEMNAGQVARRVTLATAGSEVTSESSPHIAVVIPAFRVANQVTGVISSVPPFVKTIVVVDDCSPDDTGQVLDGLARSDPRLVVTHHEENRGVGGATKSGYYEALRCGADIVVKMDADGQMDPDYMERLVTPIRSGQAEYVKGNRFRDWSYVSSMPLARRLGNLAFSLFTKIASGYWNLFDPENGYTAISAETIRELNFERLQERYLFESSILAELYLLGARVKQVSMPAIYNDAPSSLNPYRLLIEFPLYVLRATTRRFLHRYVWKDFTAVSIFVILGLLSILFGATFGVYHWIRTLQTAQPATSGRVLLSAVPVILGFQMVLQAIVLDIENVPE